MKEEENRGKSMKVMVFMAMVLITIMTVVGQLKKLQHKGFWEKNKDSFFRS